MCTLNAARVITAAAQMLGVDVLELERLALAARPGAEGVTVLPFLDGERTPNLPHASGTLGGLRRETMTPENIARAAYEGMLCNVAAGVGALRDHGVGIRRIFLIGGASVSAAVQAIAPDVLGAQVVVPVAGERRSGCCPAGRVDPLGGSASAGVGGRARVGRRSRRLRGPGSGARSVRRAAARHARDLSATHGI